MRNQIQQYIPYHARNSNWWKWKRKLNKWKENMDYDNVTRENLYEISKKLEERGFDKLAEETYELHFHYKTKEEQEIYDKIYSIPGITHKRAQLMFEQVIFNKLSFNQKNNHSKQDHLHVKELKKCFNKLERTLHNIYSLQSIKNITSSKGQQNKARDIKNNIKTSKVNSKEQSNCHSSINNKSMHTDKGTKDKSIANKRTGRTKQMKKNKQVKYSQKKKKDKKFKIVTIRDSTLLDEAKENSQAVIWITNSYKGIKFPGITKRYDNQATQDWILRNGVPSYEEEKERMINQDKEQQQNEKKSNEKKIYQKKIESKEKINEIKKGCNESEESKKKDPLILSKEMIQEESNQMRKSRKLKSSKDKSANNVRNNKKTEKTPLIIMNNENQSNDKGYKNEIKKEQEHLIHQIDEQNVKNNNKMVKSTPLKTYKYQVNDKIEKKKEYKHLKQQKINVEQNVIKNEKNSMDENSNKKDKDKSIGRNHDNDKKENILKMTNEKLLNSYESLKYYMKLPIKDDERKRTLHYMICKKLSNKPNTRDVNSLEKLWIKAAKVFNQKNTPMKQNIQSTRMITWEWTYPNLRPPKIYRKENYINKAHEKSISNFIKTALDEGKIEKVQMKEIKHFIPLGSISRKNDPNSERPREILDATLLNCYIRTTQMSMITLSHLQSIVREYNFAAVLDLKNGYHNMIITPNLRKYLGIHYKGNTYQWKCLPFGLAVAPAYFQAWFSSIIERVNGCTNYLDDVLVVGKTKSEVIDKLTKLKKILGMHGLALNETKSVGLIEPITKVEYLGRLLNFEQHSISIPIDKIKKLKDFLHNMKDKKRRTTKGSLIRFLGRLNFSLPRKSWTTCLKSLYKKVANYTKDQKNHFIKINLNEQSKLKQVISEIENKPTNILDKTIKPSHYDVYCDASGFSGGFYIKQTNEYYIIPFPHRLQMLRTIAAYKELLTACIAVEITRFTKGQHVIITIHTNSKSTQSVLYEGRAKSEEMNKLIHSLSNIHLIKSVYYIKGKLNRLADRLSRQIIYDKVSYRKTADTFNDKSLRKLATIIKIHEKHCIITLNTKNRNYQSSKFTQLIRTDPARGSNLRRAVASEEFDLEEKFYSQEDFKNELQHLSRLGDVIWSVPLSWDRIYPSSLRKNKPTQNELNRATFSKECLSKEPYHLLCLRNAFHHLPNQF